VPVATDSPYDWPAASGEVGFTFQFPSLGVAVVTVHELLSLQPVRSKEI
jgi:hypothetical protein